MSKLITKKYFESCPICDKGHDVELRESIDTILIHGLKITYREKYFHCQNAKTDECDFVTAIIGNANLSNARQAYLDKCGKSLHKNDDK